MFKKTLVAVAALAAFGTVSAANFTLYGTVDETLVYDYKKVDGDKTNTLNLKSGYNSASKFGFKGTEDLGNGLKVSFKLENQFNADDGTLHSDRLFRREASLSLSGNFGTISMGRMGGVGSSAGTYDLVYGYADAFDGGDNNVFGLVASARYDNMVTYQTPKFAGVQATVQYSFKEDNLNEDQKTAREGSAAVDRYAGAAVTGDFGPLGLVAAYEFQNYASDGNDVEDGHTVYVGGNYDCGFAKTFAMVQYFKGMSGAGEFSAENDKGIKGFGATLGTQFALLGGDTTVALYYLDGKDETKVAGAVEDDLTYFGASARYVYPLSKRTSVYAGAGAAKYERDADGDKTKTTVGQAYVGLTHQF